MELLQAAVDRSLIAIWLGHESLDSTQIYLGYGIALVGASSWDCSGADFAPHPVFKESEGFFVWSLQC